MATNKQLREQIDALRWERVVFDDIYKKLEEELEQKWKTMYKVIQEAEKAYEQRTRAK